jgi:lysophospholipase L1-like esterase
MINRKIKSVFKYILFLSIFFFLLELLARFFFPAFQANNIFYDIDKNYRISKGVHTYFNTYNGVTFRVQEYLERIKINKKKSVWFVGDSVTNGYGMTFNETYHSIFQDLINASEKKINTYAISSYGSDLKKSFDILNNSLLNIIKDNDVFIYQFHFNDISDLSKYNSNFNLADRDSTQNIFIRLTNKSQVFRYKYLNHSTLIKLFSDFGSELVRKTSGSCTERGLNALGPYTHAYFSEGYEEMSKILWNDFEKILVNTKELLERKNVDFYVLISPISLQVSHHEDINKTKLNLNCSTQEARKKLIYILTANKIKYIDPLSSFESFSKKTFKEKNIQPLFLKGDTAHPSSKGHYIMGLEVFKKIQRNL